MATSLIRWKKNCSPKQNIWLIYKISLRIDDDDCSNVLFIHTHHRMHNCNGCLTMVLFLLKLIDFLISLSTEDQFVSKPFTSCSSAHLFSLSTLMCASRKWPTDKIINHHKSSTVRNTDRIIILTEKNVKTPMDNKLYPFSITIHTVFFSSLLFSCNSIIYHL